MAWLSFLYEVMLLEFGSEDFELRPGRERPRVENCAWGGCSVRTPLCRLAIQIGRDLLGHRVGLPSGMYHPPSGSI